MITDIFLLGVNIQVSHLCCEIDQSTGYQ
uniref:Uncharacterized protein n=1 Tax=Rhizophora mucronata TaxID=61149 RepID=A0A2P2QJU7_RHIMU